MNSSKSRILIILASIREGRQGEKVAQWVRREASAYPEFEIDFIDLKELKLPLYVHSISPKEMESSYPTANERQWVETVSRADGFIIVTPEYNHGYPPALKNALDYVFSGWVRKPVAFVSYGGKSGGIRSVEQLRLVSIELQMVPVRVDVNIAAISRAFSSDGAPIDPSYSKLLSSLFNDLAWWSNALRSARMQSLK